MDIKEYIASGIIDSFVLGSASEQEKQEVQCLSKIYPEIREELFRAEAAMEAYAQSIAQTPPESLKASLLDKIRSTPQDAAESKLELVKEEAPAESEAAPTKIIALPNSYKFAAAASVLIIVLMTTLFLRESSNSMELQSELTALQENLSKEKSTFQEQLASLQNSVETMLDREAFINAPATRKLALLGTDVQPDANATIYWDEESGNVMLASFGMPQPVSGKQYQLWAIADGVPVDLGVLDKNNTFTPSISVKASNIQAFAITLEKEGGSPTPTLEQLYVIGNV